MATRIGSDPYKTLARAVIMRAALDYVMLRFPDSSRQELVEWFRSERRRLPASPSALKKWQRKRMWELGLFFTDGGDTLAKQADCYDIIGKVRGSIDRNRVWVMMNRNRPSGQRHWHWRQAAD